MERNSYLVSFPFFRKSFGCTMPKLIRMMIFWLIYHGMQFEILRKVMKIAILLLDPMNTLPCLTLDMKKLLKPRISPLKYSFLEQLVGIVCTVVQEHMSNKMNRNNYFLTSLISHNSLLLMRLLIHFYNRYCYHELINKVKHKVKLIFV